MFGNKRAAPATPDDTGYDQEFEYHAAAYLGINAFNSGVNEHARKGWELVNGAMAGTAHYAYMRRRLRRGEPEE